MRGLAGKIDVFMELMGMWLTYLLVFLFGITVGSFLTVCIDRIPAGESVISPPSRCAACGHRLGVLDLAPVLNYLYLGGRCRFCGASFAAWYPVVELLTGVLFVLVWARFGWSWAAPAGWVFVSVLVVITATDLRHGIIPNKVIIAGLALGLPLVALQSWADLKAGLIAFLAAGLFMLALAVVSRGGMGGGDIKLAALMGLFLGPPGVALALFLAFMAGGVVAALLLVTGVKKRKDPIPFGPFLAVGGLATLLWGQNLLNHWYF